MAVDAKVDVTPSMGRFKAAGTYLLKGLGGGLGIGLASAVLGAPLGVVGGWCGGGGGGRGRRREDYRHDLRDTGRGATLPDRPSAGVNPPSGGNIFRGGYRL